MSSAPIRFLVLMLGGWAGLRLAVLGIGSIDMASYGASMTDGSASGHRANSGPAIATPGHPHNLSVEARPTALLMRAPQLLLAERGSHDRPAAELSFTVPPRAHPSEVTPPPIAAAPLVAPAPSRTPHSAFLSDGAAQRLTSRRWSGAAWLLVRGDGGATLAPGGTLGGSQAGGRLLYRLNRDTARPLSLSARFYAPLNQIEAAEGAIGLDWQPFAILPIHLLAERRQRLGRAGRSAFSVAAYGGASAELARGLRLDAYAQAGIVGLRARDAFVDGSARVSTALGPVEAGAAIWGAAQPGAARFDIGPRLTLPLHTRGTSLRLSAEWRFRVAGAARPDSGPALTLGADF